MDEKTSEKTDNKSHYVVATGIIVKDGKYLITKRAEWEKAFPGKWTVPGGKLEVKDYINEKKDTKEHWYNILEKLLRREVKEETGLDINNIKYLTSMTFIRPDNIPVLIISLYCDYESGEVNLSKDMSDFKWVDLIEARNYDLIEGIYEELAMLDEVLKGKKENFGEWRKEENKEKKTIGIDIDDVIVDFIPGLLDFYNFKTGKNIPVEYWKRYYPWDNDFFNGTKEEGLELVREFFESEFFYKMNLMAGVREVLKELSEKHNLIVITARETNLKEKTRLFFSNKFPDLNLSIFYSGDLYKNGNKNKAEICKDLGISILVDDHQDYAKECAENGIKVLLFDKPWNKNCIEHENIIRVNSWDHILEKIKGGES